MLSLQQLASQTNKALGYLDIFKFEAFISNPDIYLNQHLVKILSDILASDKFSLQHKQLVASSFHLLYTKRLDRNYLEWTIKSIDQYLFHMMQRNDGDMIPWPVLSHTINGLKVLVWQIPDPWTDTIIQKFQDTNFGGKVLILQSIIANADISNTNQYVVIRQTIESFIRQALDIITKFHQSNQPTYDKIVFEHDIMLVISQCINIISHEQNHELQKEYEIMFQMGKNQQLVNLLKQQLKCIIAIKNNKYWYKVSENVYQLMDQSILQKQTQNQIRKVIQYQINIKSYILSILYFIITAHPSSFGLDEFDSIPILTLMEILTPLLINQLATNQLLKIQYYEADQSSISQAYQTFLITSFSFLTRNATFIFLFKMFQQAKQTILYDIFNDYIKATKQELDSYRDNGTQFYEMAQAFIQTDENQFCDTVKQACGNFMKSYFRLNNEAHVQYCDFLAASLKYQLNEQQSSIVNNAKSNNIKLPAIQTIYSIINKIFFYQDEQNMEFSSFVYRQFIQPQYVFKLRLLEKVRFAMLLEYSYKRYFQDDTALGTKYILWIGQTKGNTQTQYRVFLELIQNAFDAGVAQQVWNYLILQIQNTKRQSIFKKLNTIVQKFMDGIGTERILNMVIRICQRIKKQFQKDKQNFTQKNQSHASILYECLHILQEVIQNEKMIKQQDKILVQILKLVDYFNQKSLQSYEFNNHIIQLLNKIIGYQQQIPIQFQRFLNTLNNILRTSHQYGPLLQTFYLMLLKGGQTFYDNKEFFEKIQTIIYERILNVNNRTDLLIIQSIFLIQNCYLVYPDIALQNKDVFQITSKLFQDQKNVQKPNQQMIASVLLYSMAGQFAFGNYDLAKIGQCKINIFKYQFGLMFALNLRKLLEKYYETQSLQYLIQLFLNITAFTHQFKQQKQYRELNFTISIFKKYIQIDPFSEFIDSLQFLKENLPLDQYDSIISLMKNHLPEQLLKTVLTTRLFDNHKERIIVTVKKN